MITGQRVGAAEYNQAVSAMTSAKKRLSALFDNGAFTEIGAFVRSGSDQAGVCAAYGFVNGTPVYAFSQDPDINKGAVSKAHAVKICKVLELAAKNGVPVVGIYDSCGAFVEEGADALAAYGDILAAVNNLSGVVPQIAAVPGVCAGTSAVIAASADILVMTENAELYTALGAGTGSAAQAAKNGTASVVAADENEAFEQIRRIIAFLPQNNISPVPEFEYSASGKPVKGDAAEIAEALADEGSLTELSAGFGKAAYTALCSVGGSSAGFVATNKCGGRLTSDDASKIARFVRFCDAFSIPVITAVDTEGFEANAGDDLSGTVRDIAKTANAYAEATAVKIALVTGKAYGSAFTVLAGNTSGSDMIFAYPSAVISAMDPKAGAEFFYHDELKGADNVSEKRKELEARFAAEYGSVYDAAAKGAVDEIVDANTARDRIISALDISAGKRLNKRLPKKHGNMPF